MEGSPGGGDKPGVRNLKMEDYFSIYPNYVKKSIFLLNYSWKDKDEQTIALDMNLSASEQGCLSDAMKALAIENDYTGMSLDRYILMRNPDYDII